MAERRMPLGTRHRIVYTHTAPLRPVVIGYGPADGLDQRVWDLS